MFNVLIVDDDLHVRQMLEKLIDWESHGFQVIGSAVDGIDAVEKIEEYPVDLLILDMSMPQMSGLEVIKYINSEGLQVKTVVLSCHDDFQYVKEAMKYGANDYILKHTLKKEELIKEVEIVRHQLIEIEEKKKSLYRNNRLYNKSVQVHKRDLLKKILNNEHISKFVDDQIEYYYQDIQHKRFFVILIKTIHYKYVEGEFNPNGRGIYTMILHNMLEELIAEEFELVDSGQEDYILMVVVNNLDIKAVKEKIRDRLTIMERSLKEYFNVQVKFVVDFNAIPYQELSTHYRRIQNKSNYTFYERTSIIDTQSFYMMEEMKKGNTSDFIERISKHIDNNKYDEMKRALNQRYDRLFEERLDPNSMKKDFCEVMDKLLGYLDYKYHLELDRDLIDKLEEKVFGAENVDEFHIQVNQFVEYLTELSSNPLYEEVENAYVKEAIRYIQGHFQGDISLNDVAKHVHVNPTYFSQMFKTELGVNYVDYVKELRMKKACEYLVHSDLKIKEISEAVGIPNRKYFSKTFKKVIGVTPLQYKKENISC